MLGPIQFVAIEFDTLDRFEGKILERLEELTPLSAVRILDVLFIAKEDNGDVVALEMGELGGEEGDEILGTIIGSLLGFSFEGDDPELPPGEITEASAVGVSTGDIRRVARDLKPGTAAGLLLIEHNWAAGLRDAIFAAGGSMMAQGFLTLEGLAVVGAELAATAEAIAAIELAEALEAEAVMRSVEALATIEVAEEIEAAVVASTLLGLIDAGFIDPADAPDVMAAMLDDSVIAQANATKEGS